MIAAMVASFAGALALYHWLERRGRRRWTQVPAHHGRAIGGPYRSSHFVTGHLSRAPALVRAAALVGLVSAHVLAPVTAFALLISPFDGISVSLAPDFAILSFNWCCAWLLLGRSPHAGVAADTGAKTSLMANVCLLTIATAHLAIVDLGRGDGILHICSSSVTFVVFVTAAACVAHALLTLAALRDSSTAQRAKGGEE